MNGRDTWEILRTMYALQTCEGNAGDSYALVPCVMPLFLSYSGSAQVIIRCGA